MLHQRTNRHHCTQTRSNALSRGIHTSQPPDHVLHHRAPLSRQCLLVRCDLTSNIRRWQALIVVERMHRLQAISLMALTIYLPRPLPEIQQATTRLQSKRPQLGCSSLPSHGSILSPALHQIRLRDKCETALANLTTGQAHVDHP